MKVLVACEFSGAVRRAFRSKGAEAWSCDLLPSDDASPYHRQEDVTPLLEEDWDIVIAFPPCTHLCSSGARWWTEKRADGRQRAAEQFFMLFADLKIPHCIENPIGRMSSVYRKPCQIIQPWQFGHGETKATCLWLTGLPPLMPTKVVDGREPRIHRMSPSANRSKLRSVTFEGIANAMADQWGTADL